MTTAANINSAAASWRAPWPQKATAANANSSVSAGVKPQVPKDEAQRGRPPGAEQHERQPDRGDPGKP